MPENEGDAAQEANAPADKRPQAKQRPMANGPDKQRWSKTTTTKADGNYTIYQEENARDSLPENAEARQGDVEYITGAKTLEKVAWMVGPMTIFWRRAGS